MTRTIFKALALIAMALMLASCAGSNNPYGDPDAQRDRSKDAQDEMRRDTRY